MSTTGKAGWPLGKPRSPIPRDWPEVRLRVPPWIVTMLEEQAQAASEAELVRVPPATVLQRWILAHAQRLLEASKEPF